MPSSPDTSGQPGNGAASAPEAAPSEPESAPPEPLAAAPGQGSIAPAQGTVASAGRLRRFVPAERVSHWTYALLFIVAFVTGLLMWIPATRIWMAGARYTLSQYHGYVGTAMIVLPLVLFFLIDRRRLGRDIREIDTWDWNDRRWFWLAVRGHTLRGRTMPPQGRFNAGQKMNVVLIAAMAVGFGATGGILMHRQSVPPWLVSRALWLHGFLAICAIALFAGHLAHVFITRHGRTYLSSMVRGWIPAELARERHLRWWQAETGGKPAATAGAGGTEVDPGAQPGGGSGPVS